ncbi:hypothetical protein ACFV0R_10105 [Streptomyces sp. NPDC059578]|uniref:hypothetical protein n=1 Tax=Streptomyces sp. NPDC059578 TaxID=3346874 RepID=UPI003694AA5A
MTRRRNAVRAGAAPSGTPRAPVRHRRDPRRGGRRLAGWARAGAGPLLVALLGVGLLAVLGGVLTPAAVG